MSYKHEHLKVQDLCIEAEEFGDTLVHNPIPLIILPFNSWCAEANAVAPVMPDLSNLEFKFFFRFTITLFF